MVAANRNPCRAEPRGSAGVLDRVRTSRNRARHVTGAMAAQVEATMVRIFMGFSFYQAEDAPRWAGKQY